MDCLEFRRGLAAEPGARSGWSAASKTRWRSTRRSNWPSACCWRTPRARAHSRAAGGSGWHWPPRWCSQPASASSAGTATPAPIRCRRCPPRRYSCATATSVRIGRCTWSSASATNPSPRCISSTIRSRTRANSNAAAGRAAKCRWARARCCCWARTRAASRRWSGRWTTRLRARPNKRWASCNPRLHSKIASAIIAADPLQACAMPELSVVVPVYNERDNIPPLLDEIVKALRGRVSFEIVYVDDASDDDSLEVLKAERSKIPELRIVRHLRRSGQSTAIWNGVRAATGEWIATLDGDGQNDPADIPKLLDTRSQSNANVKLFAGWRTTRRDTFNKRISSKIANGVRSRMLRDDTPDTGCGLKLF